MNELLKCMHNKCDPRRFLLLCFSLKCVFVLLNAKKNELRSISVKIVSKNCVYCKKWEVFVFFSCLNFNNYFLSSFTKSTRQ